MTRSVKTEAIVLYAGLVLFAVLALPSGRAVLEAQLATHMLVQLPLLSVAGWLIGVATRAAGGCNLSRINRHGLTGIVLFACVALLWMVPRLLEMSLSDPATELAKFVSLPLAGLSLAWSYAIAPVVLRGVLLTHAISMLAAMGWAYLAAPTRLCNAYLADDQVLTGALLLASSVALAVGIGVSALLTEPHRKVTACVQPGTAI